MGNRLADGVGSLLVGTLKPGIEAYQGLMQDVRIFTRTLDEGLEDCVIGKNLLNGYF